MSTRPSYDYGATDYPLLYETIGHRLEHIVERFPDNEALVSMKEGIRLTYRELNERVDLLAKGLMKLGIGRGDRVGIWAINRHEWTLVQYATAKIGAVLVNINPAYRTHELKYALSQSETQTLVLMHEFKSSKYKQMLYELCPDIEQCEPGALDCPDLPSLKNVVFMDDPVPGTFSFDEVMDKGREVPDEELRERLDSLDPDDDINIQYTSGTTGFPKGVTLTHFNILNNGYHTALNLKFTDADRLVIPVPFYHCFGMVLSNLACMSTGACTIIPGPIFDPGDILVAVSEEKATALHGVPTMFIAELNHPEFDSFDLSTLRTGIMAGAPCPVDTMNEVISKMNMREVTIVYGQTEVSPAATMTLPDDSVDKRVSTVGRVMPWQEIKIIDPVTGATVPRGVQGEICFRGYHLMSRYYNNPEATAQTVDDRGWLHSGDLGTMDDEGYVKITGRIKEMVIRGGENLYPREIEEFLRTHDKVMDVYVIGVPDEKYGEELMAWVLPTAGETLTEDEMRAFCKGKIAHFKIPRYWKFVSSAQDFPMTVTGKVQKFKMREIAIEELGLHGAATIETA